MDNNDILQHYGVLGMKWGVRKAARYYNKSRSASAKAKELDAKAKYEKEVGNMSGAEKYRTKANEQRVNAQHYGKQANTLRGNTSMKDVRVMADRARNNSAVARKVISTTGKVIGIGGMAAASLIGAVGTICGGQMVYEILNAMSGN